MAEMDSCQGEPDLFDLEIIPYQFNSEGNLPVSLFREIEADLCNKLLHSSSPEDDQTDGPLEFIQKIVDNVREEFEDFLEDGDKKIFLRILTKIFSILLCVKADNTEKIIKIVKFTISVVLKTWSGQN